MIKTRGAKKARPATQTVAFSRRMLKRDILREAKVLKIALGSAEAIADITVEKVAHWAEGRGAITERDLDKIVAQKLKPYNEDLAYVFRERGKII